MILNNTEVQQALLELQGACGVLWHLRFMDDLQDHLQPVFLVELLEVLDALDDELE